MKKLELTKIIFSLLAGIVGVAMSAIKAIKVYMEIKTTKEKEEVIEVKAEEVTEAN